jgi:hypothetical protein
VDGQPACKGGGRPIPSFVPRREMENMLSYGRGGRGLVAAGAPPVDYQAGVVPPKCGPCTICALVICGAVFFFL